MENQKHGVRRNFQSIGFIVFDNTINGYEYSKNSKIYPKHATCPCQVV